MTKVIKILKILNFKPSTLPANSLVPPKARKLSAGKVFHILGDSEASLSGREKRRKSPWVKQMLAPDWAQKMLCIIEPNRQTASPEFFS